MRFRLLSLLLLLLTPGCMAEQVAPPLTTPPPIHDSYPIETELPTLTAVSAVWSADSLIVSLTFDGDPGVLNADWSGWVLIDTDNNILTGYRGFGQGTERVATLADASWLTVPVRPASEKDGFGEPLEFATIRGHGLVLDVYVPLSSLDYPGGKMRVCGCVWDQGQRLGSVKASTVKPRAFVFPLTHAAPLVTVPASTYNHSFQPDLEGQ